MPMTARDDDHFCNFVYNSASMEFIKLAVIGLALGITTIIPGVSTSTTAVILNVYDRLIEVITPNIKKILAAWKFWLPLAVGIAAGIFFFSKAITFLFANYEIPSYWFFIGIILGSLPPVYARARRPPSLIPALPPVICCVLALALMALIAFLKPEADTATYTILTPPLFGILVGGGALSAIAMIIPGISGSFLLLVIGLYRTIVQAVSELNIPLILPVALGAVIGLLAGAAFVRFLLAKAPRETYGAVLGLVAGSVFVLYPGGFGSGITILLSLISLLAGGALSFFLGKQNRENIVQN